MRRIRERLYIVDAIILSGWFISFLLARHTDITHAYPLAYYVTVCVCKNVSSCPG